MKDLVLNELKVYAKEVKFISKYDNPKSAIVPIKKPYIVF